MTPGKLQIVVQSIRFYKKPVLYQILIIALLSAVITGSLLTGRSVRESLMRTASTRLGNTGVIISSGLRYFDNVLANRMRNTTGLNCTGILELTGYCQSLYSQTKAFNTHIYAVNNDFFPFNGNDSLIVKPGEVVINKRLADYLAVNEGDELIIHFRSINAIPADAPFAPSGDPTESVVLRIGAVTPPDCIGNFSLSVSQIMPLNIFMNPEDLEKDRSRPIKINRLLVHRNNSRTIDEISDAFKKVLKANDIGLSLRMVTKTGQAELISDRIFIDAAILNEIRALIPSSAPVITYLGNRFKKDTLTTPYSFISALPSSLYPEIASGDSIIINSWMASDLAASEGDTLEMYWYAPDSLNKLFESRKKFVIRKIVEMEGIWSDSLLMPDFPGISGRESCSDWDAGVPIRMNQIRPKDEEYWNNFRGTPKAFISYTTGKELWGNNFGPATSVRFPAGITIPEIENRLTGTIDPRQAGFTFTDIYDESIKAANEGVDFSTLFLSLGFFLILAAIVLLSFAVSSYFDSKREQISTYFALGFRNSWIESLLFLESFLIILTGGFIGAFAGYLVNILITAALNSVWQGAVQTDTLGPFFTIIPVLTGFIITIVTALILMKIKIRRFLNSLNQKENKIFNRPSIQLNFIFLSASVVISISLYLFSMLFRNMEMALCFASGSMLFIALILSWRQYYIGLRFFDPENIRKKKDLSRLYYLFYPSHAVTPIMFIAAGVFAVFITDANRSNIREIPGDRSSGTGGYLLWCENTIPIKEDLNSLSGRRAFGIDEDTLSDMKFVQILRSSGNDASCLNLNHIISPPLLGIDPSEFIEKGCFSFSRSSEIINLKNSWQYLNIPEHSNTIYGIADQTVLEWGLKLKTGDTLKLRAENGKPLNIILAAGLNSSVFQGFVLIGKENMKKFYPSVSGSSVLLVEGNPELEGLYKSTLADRLDNYGVSIENTHSRLASFREVTNTYLSVFGAFGALGMITGIAGLGFVLLRNYNRRKREFALMMATGFSLKKIRRDILSDQLIILFAGISTGAISAIVATLPSIRGNHDIPWLSLSLMALAIFLTGLIALFVSIRAISSDSLSSALKKE